jgi:hypothetical protein
MSQTKPQPDVTAAPVFHVQPKGPPRDFKRDREASRRRGTRAGATTRRLLRNLPRFPEDE